MQKLPKVVTKLTEKFERLPGIGPRSAQRIVFYLLHNPESQLQEFADRLVALKKETCLCQYCHQISETETCSVCTDTTRDEKVLCVVEQPLDALAIEKSEKYQGKYHILHGSIDPLNRVGPDELYLRDIVARLEGVEELILATNPTLEGEATAMYIAKMVESNPTLKEKVKITRIGHGLPIGADIEYADPLTLSRALAGRSKI